MKSFRGLSLAVFFLADILGAGAQQPSVTPLTTSTSGGGSINLKNLDVSLTFPIIVKPGRGVPASLAVSYNGNFWSPAFNQWSSTPSFGWSFDPAVPNGSFSMTDTDGLECQTQPFPLYIETYTSRRWTDSLGTVHQFGGKVVWNQCTDVITATPAIVYSDGYSIDVDNNVRDVNGLSVNYAQMVDTNGNSVTIGPNSACVDPYSTTSPLCMMDTLGKPALVGDNVEYVGPTQPTIHYIYQDTSGTARVIEVVFSTQTVRTNFGIAGITEYGPVSAQLVQKIIYQDKEYDFTYEATPGYAGDTTGRIKTITRPEGGVVSYNYNGPNDSMLADGSSNRVEIVTSDSATPTVYTRTEPTSSTASVAVSHPSGASESYSLFRLPGFGTSSYVPTSSTVMGETTSICYDGGGGTPYTCATSGITLPITKQTSTINRDGVSKKRVEIFDGYGQSIETDQYDWSTTGTYTPLQKTIKTYNSSLGTILNRVATEQVTDGSGNQISYETFSYDEFALTDDPSTPTSGLFGFTAPASPRGNLTTKTDWVSTDNSTLSSHYHYDNAGVLQYEIAAGTGAQTTYKHDPTDSFITETHLPTVGGVGLVLKATHDPYTGLLTVHTDANAHTESYAYDSALRVQSVTRDTSNGGDGGVTTFSYPDNNTDIVNSKIQTGSSTQTETRYIRDSYGRSNRVAVTNGQAINPYYWSDSCYDGDGRQYFTSKRYQGTLTSSLNCSGNGDVIAFDINNRIIKITHSDGSHLDYAYYGRSVKVTDEGNSTQHSVHVSESDGIGRSKSVCEYLNTAPAVGSATVLANCNLDINALGPDGPKQGMLTTYVYGVTATANTVQVNNAGQTRSWSMDSLGRTVQETIPERSGSVTFGYSMSSSGYVSTRTRPRANQPSSTVTTTATTTMDILGRTLSVQYANSDSSTPDGSVSVAYDAVPSGITGMDNYLGRAVSISKGNYVIYNSYNSNGATEWKSSCVAVTCGSGTPNVIKQTFVYDLLGRTVQWADGNTGQDYLQYTTASELNYLKKDAGVIIQGATYGADGPTAISYDSRSAQVTHDGRGRITAVAIYSGTNALIYGYGIGWAPNGQVTQSCDNLAGDFTNGCAPDGTHTAPVHWTYTYDELNRLTDAATSSATSERSFQYDGWGNRWTETIVKGSGLSTPVLSFGSTNRISTAGYVYDAAGNLIGDNTGSSFTYDAEGRMLTAMTGGVTSTYTYGPDGQRWIVASGSSSESYVYGPGGKPSTIWDTTGRTLKSAPRYFGNSRLGYITAARTFSYEFEVMQSSSGYQDATGTAFHVLPFGEDIASGLALDSTRFAGMEWDPGSKTAHSGTRQYSPTAGRWMSPDSFNGSYHPGDPQSFNRYSYVQNSPMTDVDPLGLAREGLDEDYTDPLGGNDTLGGDNTAPKPPICQDDPDVCSAVHKAIQWLVDHLSAPSSGTANTEPAPTFGDGMSGIGFSQFAGTFHTVGLVRTPAQQTQPQLVVTMTMVSPTYKTSKDSTETVVAFGIASMNTDGKLTPLDDTDGSHYLTMTETLDPSKTVGKAPKVCSPGCYSNLSGNETQKDYMTVSRNNAADLTKTFKIDRDPAKVIDPSTGKPHDFIHETISVKNGTSLTFGDNP